MVTEKAENFGSNVLKGSIQRRQMVATFWEEPFFFSTQNFIFFFQLFVSEIKREWMIQLIWFDFFFKPEFLCFGYDRFEEGSVWWSILSLVALFHWLSRRHSLRWITVVTSVRFWLRVLFGCWKNVEGSNLSSEHYPLLGCWEK